MKKTTKAHLYNKFIVAALWCMITTLSSFGQCPTVVNPTQSFCDIQAPMVGNLVATNNGGGVRWYSTPTSTIPLSNTQGLINNQDYYADDLTGSCGSRQRVKAIIFGPPVALSYQGVCVEQPEDATISDLFVVGNDVQWYNVPTGGSPLTPTTLLTDGTIYYVNQSNPYTGCRTSRFSVLVSVGIVPLPSGSSIQQFCNDVPPTVADLEASGSNNWYSTSASGSPLPLTTPLIDGESYFATTVDPPCESIGRLQVTVEIIPPNNSGGNGEIEICETGLVSTNTINLFDGLLGTPDTNGTWSGPLPTTNGSTGRVNVSTMNVNESPYVFTYSVSSETCPTSSSTVSILIIEGPDPGTNGSLVLCVNDSAQDLFERLEGTPEFGGIWSPALASGTGIFDPSKDAAGLYTYTIQGVPPCGEVSATVEVTVNPEAEPGINGNLTLCEDSAPEDLFNSLGGSPQSGGIWTPALASGTGVFDPSVDPAGNYIYTVQGIAPCGEATSQVSVTIIPKADAGNNGSLVLCSNDASQDLFNSLNGTPKPGGTWSPALISGNGVFDPAQDAPGVYTYTVQGTSPCGEATATVNVSVNPETEPGTNGNLILCIDSAPQDLFNSLGGSPQPGGTWTPALASGTGVFDPSKDLAGTYIYNLSGITPCGDASSTVTVTINPLANAGTNGSLILCSNEAPQNLFDSLGGTPETGGTWSPALVSGTGVFDPSVDTAGNYTYTVQGNAPCGPATAIVNVTVNPAAEPGTNGNLALCIDSAPQNLFNSLGGTPESGGTWSPALVSGTGVFDPSKDAAGTYTYSISGITPCGESTSTVTVTINPLANAGTNGSVIVCSNDASKDLFDSLGGTPETGGVWSPALASGTGIFDPSKDAPGNYTYTVQGVAPCGVATAIINVAISPVAEPGTDGALSICIDGTPQDLFNSLGGTPESGGTWTPALSSGTGVFDPSKDAAGVYTYTIKGDVPCGDATAKVTVSIAKIPQAGSGSRLAICSNDAPQDLFESLGGTPDLGGTWSPALASGSGIFNPVLDSAGAYTYTITTACGTDSAIVTVAIVQSPNITGLTLSTNDICLDEAIVINLSGATQLNDGNYNLNYALTGANNTEDTVAVTITNGNAVISIPDSQLTVVGSTTFTILNLLDPVTNCGTASSTLPTVTFNIEQAQTPQLVTNGNTFCFDDNPTIANLTSNLIGADQIIWYDALENGNAYSDDMPLVDGDTYYASNSTVNGCTNGIRLAVTVKIDQCDSLGLIIPDGFSPNGDNINDDFRVKNLRELYPDFKLQIYNRYGNILYKGDTNTLNWDGTSNQGREVGNGVLPVGVYYYILELNNPNSKTLQGSVYLSR